VSRQMSNFSAISWREQVTLDKMICYIRFVLDQYSPLKKNLKLPKG